MQWVSGMRTDRRTRVSSARNVLTIARQVCLLALVGHGALSAFVPDVATAAESTEAAIVTIEAAPRTRTEPQRALLSEWWSRGNTAADADYIGRVREVALAKPYDSEMLRHYVFVASTAQQSDLAKKDIERVVAGDPEDPRGHYALGLLSRGDSAAVHFDKALALDADFAPALEAKAVLALNATPPNVDQALELALRAARLDKSRSTTYTTLAQIYNRMGDTPAEMLSMERAIASDPENPGLRQALLNALVNASRAGKEAGQTAEWAELATATLERSASVGNAPDLLVIAARIWAAEKNGEKAEAALFAAVDAGYSDPGSLRADPSLGALIPKESLDTIITAAQENRKKDEPRLRAELRKERLDLPAPDFGLMVMNDGRTVQLSELKGKVVVLDFWATWCGPCRKSIPQIQSFYEKKLPDVEVFCVNVFERDGGVKVAPFWNENNYPMPVLLGTQETAETYGVRSIPTLFVIGPDGKIRYRHQGLTPDLAEKLQWMAEDAALP